MEYLYSIPIHIPYDPWCWYIYLQNWVIFRENVGKYTSTMEHVGIPYSHTFLVVAHIFIHHEIRHQHTAVLHPQGLPAVIAQDQHRPAVGGKQVLDSEENPTTAGPGPVQR